MRDRIHDLTLWQLEDLPFEVGYRLEIHSTGKNTLYYFYSIWDENRIEYGLTTDRDGHESDLIIKYATSLDVAMAWFESAWDEVQTIGNMLYLLENR